MSEPLLRLRGVSRRFGTIAALSSLNLDVAEGEFLALLGGSGSGKSTLLRVIAGFERPDAGDVFLDGREMVSMPPHLRPVNMMFQSYALFPHLSVFNNVAYGLKREGRSRAEVNSRVTAALATVQLGGLEERKPNTLSGGQRQRTALARALIKRPRVLLLDEPLGALDAALRERTGFELRKIQRESGAAFVMVTHDQAEALSLADRVAVFDKGRVVQQGSPSELYERPETRFVANFLGNANVLVGRRTAEGALECAGAGCTLRASAPMPMETTACALRPEKLLLTSESNGDNAIAGVVDEVAFRGADNLVVVRLRDDEVLRAVLPVSTSLQRGNAINLRWAAAAVIPLRD